MPVLMQLRCTFDNALRNLTTLYRAFMGGRKSHTEETLFFSLRVVKVAVSHTFLPDFYLFIYFFSMLFLSSSTVFRYLNNLQNEHEKKNHKASP